MKEYPLIELPGLDAIEAEKGEVLVNPNQVTFAINGKTHAKGGTKMLAEAGSYILSDHLKLDADVVDTLIGVKKKMSPAKLSKMYDTQKWADIMESNDKRYDELAKTTAAMMFAKNSARQGMIYQAQEQLKAKKGMKNDLENAMSKSTFQTGGKTGKTGKPMYAQKGQYIGPYSQEWYSNNDAMTTQQAGLGPLGVDEFGNIAPMTNYSYEQNAVDNRLRNTSGMNNKGVPKASKQVNINPSFNAPSYLINGTETPSNETVPGLFNGTKPIAGVQTTSVNGNRLESEWKPLGSDKYWGVRDKTLGASPGSLTPEVKNILGAWQSRISTLTTEFPGQEGQIMEKELAKYLRTADQVEADKYLEKYVVMADGSEIPLSSATDAQITDSQRIRFLNTRTGKADLVDFRDRQNQGFNPAFKSSSSLGEFQTVGQGIIPGAVKVAPQNITPAQIAAGITVPASTAVAAVDPTAPPKGVDWQSIVNGTQIGLLATDLATTRTKPPYYDYASSEIAYTRFEPINTKQQERAFSIARQSIENSNLPQQVKQAQLSNMYGTMAEGVNQVDITNYQNKLANDNRNIQTFNQVRNTDIQWQQDSNMRYVQEADRRNYMASAQRQEYLSNIMDTWSKHVSNRRDVRLVNQVANNYDYNFNSEQVEYTPGQGTKPNTNRLQAYGTSLSAPQIDPRYLNAEGRKALGYDR